MSKTFLIIIGVALIAVGVIALLPNMNWFTEPVWQSVVKIVVGVVAVIVAAMDRD